MNWGLIRGGPAHCGPVARAGLTRSWLDPVLCSTSEARPGPGWTQSCLDPVLAGPGPGWTSEARPGPGWTQSWLGPVLAGPGPVSARSDLQRHAEDVPLLAPQVTDGENAGDGGEQRGRHANLSPEPEVKIGPHPDVGQKQNR